MADTYLTADEIASYAKSPRIADVVATAEKAGKLTPLAGDMTHFAGTSTAKSGIGGLLDWIRNGFSTPKTEVATQGIANALSELTVQEEALKYAKDNGISSAITSTEEKIAKLRDSLRTNAETLIPQMAEAKEARLAVRTALSEAQATALNHARQMHMTVAGDPAISEAAREAAITKLNTTEAAIKAHYTPLIEDHSKVIDGIKTWEQQIEKHAGVKVDEVMAKLKTSAEKAAPLVAEGAKDLAAAAGTVANKEGQVISKAAQELGILGEKGLEAKGGYLARKWADVVANFKTSGALSLDKAGEVVATKSSALNKGIKVLSTGAGVFLIGSGLKDLGKFTGIVSPDVDEQGKEVPADSGTLIKSAVEVGAGAALAYFSLLKGGKAAGMVK